MPGKRSLDKKEGEQRSGAVLFDLDGTLVDSTSDITRALNASLSEQSLPAYREETVRTFIGDGLTSLIRRALGSPDHPGLQEVTERFKKHYRAMLLENTHPYPGVPECLERLHRNFWLFVISNKNQDFSEMILDGLGLKGYFETVIGGDTLGTRKPDPGAAYFIRDQYRIDPSRMIMVGDNHTDNGMAKNAGILSIFFTGGMGVSGETTPDFRIDRFAELPPLVEGLFLKRD